MEKQLHARPNLDHLRGQAKSLLAALWSGEATAAQTFIDHLPAAKNMSADQVRAAGLRLADAQSAIARQSGFESWPSLSRHVEKLRSMEGTWEFVTLEIEGQSIPASSLANSRLLIDGDRFRMESPEATYEGIFNIDVDESPSHIDIEFVEGPEAGNWSYGLFELKGDDLTICLGLTGASRPTGFKTSPGTGHALETLKRASAARPAGVDGGVPQPKMEVADLSDIYVPVHPMHARLEGEWSPVQVVRDGVELPQMMLKTGKRTGTGTETEVRFGGQVMIHVRTRIDDSVTPIAVDYLNMGGASIGLIQLGIMEWVGDEARFCFASPGDPRPAEFTSEPGSGRTLSHWKPL